MRPYLAIISDSFHAALASRVLWAAFLAIWILLATLAPIGLREDYTTTFRWFDVYNGTRMKAMLAQGIVDPAARDLPIGRIAQAMPEELRRELRRVGEGDEVRIRLNLLTDALNELIDADAGTGTTEITETSSTSEPLQAPEPSTTKNSPLPDVAPTHPSQVSWYDEDAWADTVRLRELRELDETPAAELTDSLLRRRSRLRIEAALPGVFESRSARSVVLTYAGLEFPTDFQIDRAQFDTLFNQFVIPVLVNWLLGLVLVFLGVLVTASIVPDMLQAGSLHLLLSKPITRSGLLISKFIGGCAFVTLCVSQLVLGLYLIAGCRLDVWNSRILWCVPIAVVIFAVFFSVSVLAGLKWRSAIISIAAAGALAAICVVVGIVGGVVNARVVAPDRIIGMTRAGEDLFAATGGSGLVHLHPTSQRWVPVIESEAGSRDRVLTPVTLDPDHVLTARIRNGRFNPFGSGSLDLIVLSRTEGWQPQPSLRLPTATEHLLCLHEQAVAAINTGDLLVTDPASILEAVGETPRLSVNDDVTTDTGDDLPGQIDDTPANRSARAVGSVSSWLKSLVTMQGGATDSFVSILPPDVVLNAPFRVTQVPHERTLIALTADRLQRMEPTGPRSNEPWTTTAHVNLPHAVDRAAPVIAASTRWVVVAQGEQPFQIFDARTLQLAGQWDTETRQSAVPGTPLELIAVSENHFLLRTSSGHCDIVEVVGPTIQHVSRLPVDDTESVHWQPAHSETASGDLVVAHNVDRLTRFSIDIPHTATGRMEATIEDSITPALSVWRWVDHYVVGGLEWLTPQVLQLGDTTAAVVSGQDSLVIGNGDRRAAEVVRYRIAGPLLSCGTFITAMLLIGCVYFSRSDY